MSGKISGLERISVFVRILVEYPRPDIFFPFFNENGYLPKNQKISDLLHHSMSTWALVCIFLLHECWDTCTEILIHSPLCQGSTLMSRYADIKISILYPFFKITDIRDIRKNFLIRRSNGYFIRGKGCTRDRTLMIMFQLYSQNSWNQDLSHRSDVISTTWH